MILIPLSYFGARIVHIIFSLIGLVKCYPTEDSLLNKKALFKTPTTSRGFIYPWMLSLNHVGHAWYISNMEIPRYYFFLSRSFKDIPIVGSLSISYHYPMSLFSLYTIETSLLGFDSRWFYVKQVIIGSKGKICTTMISKVKIVRSGPKSRPSPSEYLKEIGYGEITSPIFTTPSFPEIKKE